MQIPIQISAIANSVGTHLSVPPPLILAIIEVESNFDTFAIRYEPAFYKAYVEGRSVGRFGSCSLDTEMRARATSWGLMQLMGQTARELGYDLPFLSNLCDPQVGVSYGTRYLDRQLVRYGGDVDAAIAAYNAGTAQPGFNGARFVNQEYVEKVRAAHARQTGSNW